MAVKDIKDLTVAEIDTNIETATNDLKAVQDAANTKERIVLETVLADLRNQRKVAVKRERITAGDEG